MFASLHLKRRIYNFTGIGKIVKWVKSSLTALQLIYVLDVE
jgi:hypothetical protein